MNQLSIILLALVLTAGAALAADPPAILNHQGRIAVSGTNHDGTGYFKFAFVDSAGSTTYWSNDGTGAGGAEPTDAVAVVVNSGHYAVGLGDTSLTHMTAISPDTFTDHDDVHLRIWFSTAMGGPFEQLSPDRRITSSAYALNAAQAQGVADNGVTESSLADGAVTTSKLAAGSVTTSKMTPGSVDNSILAAGSAGENIDAQGSMGIGSDGSEPDAAIDLDGEVLFLDPLLLSVIKDGVDGFNELDRARAVDVENGIAYVVSYNDNSLTIVDVSTPSTPALLAEMKHGVNGVTGLATAECVLVDGDTVYVGAGTKLSIIDVTDPSTPVLLAELEDGVGGFNLLTRVWALDIEGDTLCAASAADSDNAVTLIDVSTPSAPVLLAEIQDGVNGFNGLDGAWDVDIDSGTLYVAGARDSTLSIIDIATPTAPVLLAELQDGVGGFDDLLSVRHVQVVGTRLYAATAEPGVMILDVTSPAAPTILGVIREGENGIDQIESPWSLDVVGTTVYLAAGIDETFTIIDAGTPAAPRLLAQIQDDRGGFNELFSPGTCVVDGTTAYVPSLYDDALTIIDVNHWTKIDLATSNRVGIGTTRPDAMLHVEGDAFVSGNLRDSSFQSGGSGQILSATGTGTSWIDLLDNDPANELQDLSLSGDTLSLTEDATPVDLGRYFLGDGSENFTGQLNVTGARIRIDNEQAYTALDSSGTVREMLKKTSNDETSIATAQNENITFKDGSNINMVMTGDNGYFGIGELDPLARLHVRNADTGYSATDDADLYVEDIDAGISVLSTEDGSVGSYLNFVEVNSGTGVQTDRWTFRRETTGGSGNSILNLEYHDGSTTEVAAFDTDGSVTMGGDINLATPKTDKLHVPAAAFVSGSTSDTFSRNVAGIIINGTTSLQLYAPVNLPTGATVASIKFYVNDGSVENFSTFRGELNQLEGGYYYLGLCGFVEATPPATSGTSSIADAFEINSFYSSQDVIYRNKSYTLSADFTVTGASAGLVFLGAEIEYTYDTVTP